MFQEVHGNRTSPWNIIIIYLSQKKVIIHVMVICKRSPSGYPCDRQPQPWIYFSAVQFFTYYLLIIYNIATPTCSHCMITDNDVNYSNVFMNDLCLSVRVWNVASTAHCTGCPKTFVSLRIVVIFANIVLFLWTPGKYCIQHLDVHYKYISMEFKFDPWPTVTSVCTTVCGDCNMQYFGTL